MSPTLRVLALFGGLFLILPGYCVLKAGGADMIITGGLIIAAGVLLVILAIRQRRK
jgi:hypothetical protein